MRTLILTAALTVLTVLSFAQKVSDNGTEVYPVTSEVKVALFSNVSDQVTLIVTKAPEDKLELKIKDEKGRLVFEKRLRKPANRKITFDLRNLPVGDYSFELKRGKEIIYTDVVTKGSASIALSK